MSEESTVFVVDDDALARKSVCALAESMGLQTESFDSAEQFLATVNVSHRGCIVTDMRMLGMSGLELQEELKRRNVRLPVVVITAFARTSITVQAIQQGAVTLLEKPCDDQQLWEAICEAIRRDEKQHRKEEEERCLQSRFDSLTTEEWSVLKRMLEGKKNKTMAHELDVSTRTIEPKLFTRSIF